MLISSYSVQIRADHKKTVDQFFGSCPALSQDETLILKELIKLQSMISLCKSELFNAVEGNDSAKADEVSARISFLRKKQDSFVNQATRKSQQKLFSTMRLLRALASIDRAYLL